MKFTEMMIGNQLELMGFGPSPDGIWKLNANDVIYIVNFKKQECYKFDGTNVPEDEDDGTLCNIQQLIQNVMSGEQPENNECGESSQDATDQSSNHEKPSTQIDVAIPNKNVVPFTPGIKGIVPQLCECGKIKIGMKGEMTESKRGNNFRPPQKLDHFLVTTMQKTDDDDFVEDEVIMKKLGSDCKEIPVMLIYDDPNLNFMTSLAYYDSAKCKCRGNGEVAIKADGTQIPCDPENCEYAQQKKCKPNGVLSVVLQDAPRVGGVWKFRTTGWNSIRNLMSSIEFIHGLTGGRLAGLPMMLTLQPKTTVIPGSNTRTTIYMVNIEFRGTMGELLNKAATRLATPEQIAQIEAKAAEMLALPESSEECQDVQEEFYPETIVGGDA